MQVSRTHFLIGILTVFVIALGLRIALTHQFVGLSAPPDAAANSDQVDYELLAHHLVSGEGYAITPGKPTASRTPGTSMTLAPVYAAFGRSFTMGRVWFYLLSALTCVLVVWLGAVMFSRSAGLLAGLGLAVYPGHAYNAMHFVSETPFGFWLVLALLLTVLAAKRQGSKLGFNIAAGICWAMAVYARPNILLALPVAGVLVGFAFLLKDRRHLRPFVVQAAVLALVLSPWVLRNASVMGQPTLSTITGYGLWGSHNRQTFSDPEQAGRWVKASELIDEAHPLTGDEVQRNQQAMHYGVEAIKAHVGEMPGLVGMKLWRLVSPMTQTDNRIAQLSFAVSWIAVAPVMLLGMVVAFRRRRGYMMVLMLPLLGTIASTVVFYGSVRFRDAVAPAFVVFAAVGIDYLIRTLRVSRQRSNRPAGKIKPSQETARAA